MDERPQSGGEILRPGSGEGHDVPEFDVDGDFNTPRENNDATEGEYVEEGEGEEAPYLEEDGPMYEEGEMEYADGDDVNGEGELVYEEGEEPYEEAGYEEEVYDDEGNEVVDGELAENEGEAGSSAIDDRVVPPPEAAARVRTPLDLQVVGGLTTTADPLFGEKPSGSGAYPSLASPTQSGESRSQKNSSRSDPHSARDEYINLYIDAMELRDKLIADSARLQNAIAVHMEKHVHADKSDTSLITDQTRHQNYLTQLLELDKLRGDIEEEEHEQEELADDLKQKLDEKEAEEYTARARFMDRKKEVARASQHSRTGKPMAEDTIENNEQKELAKDIEVSKVRLEFIKLTNLADSLRDKLRMTEEIEGLHLIDFEQKKIENQTYNEKIEERSEEILKLRKKITNTVQVLTHLKEKLQFVQLERAKHQESLLAVEEQVRYRRDALARLKIQRDQLRATNVRLKEESGLVGSYSLLRDYEIRKEHSEDLEHMLHELKERHALLVRQTKAYSDLTKTATARQPIDSSRKLKSREMPRKLPPLN